MTMSRASSCVSHESHHRSGQKLQREPSMGDKTQKKIFKEKEVQHPRAKMGGASSAMHCWRFDVHKFVHAFP